MIIVSACLLGENCKYNGKNNKNEKILDFLKDKDYIKICPEVMGGMSTPRLPSEISGERVINSSGEDVTNFFLKGANEVLKIAKAHNPTLIILKAKSPSCGLGKIYDGSFSSTLIDGDGITAKILRASGYKVITENDL